MPTFPKKIYVRWEPVRNEAPYLSASRFVKGEDGEKIAIYVDHLGMPSHTAKQKGPGIWTSKLGDCEDIDHFALDVLAGPDPAYGAVVRFMRRRKA